jgi:hypothetical protein
MKTILLFVFVSFTLATTAQTSSSKSVVTSIPECDAVTQRIIQNYYTLTQQKELEKDPRKLSKLNFVMSQSYRFTNNQMVLRSQKVLFDPKRFESFRKKNYRVTIYDELTGLYVEMFSWDEVDKQLAQIDFQCDLVLCD